MPLAVKARRESKMSLVFGGFAEAAVRKESTSSGYLQAFAESA